MEKNFVTDLTAMNATETTKTLIDTYQVPLGVSKLVEVGVQFMATGITTLESVGGILELECDDSSAWGGTQQFATEVIECVTSGAVVLRPAVHDCNIPVQPGSNIKFSVTCNEALTINPSVRCFGKFA